MKREKQEQKLGRSAPLSLCVSFTAGFLKKESGVIIIHARLRERKKKWANFCCVRFFFLVVCVIFDVDEIFSKIFITNEGVRRFLTTDTKIHEEEVETSPFLQSLSVRFFFEKSEKPFLRQIVYFERRVCVVPRLQ